MTNFEFSSWSDHLEISDSPHLWGKFLPSNVSKNFYALFDDDVGMKNNQQVQGYLTHVKSSSYNALNESKKRKRDEHEKFCFHHVVSKMLKIFTLWNVIFRLPTFFSNVSKIFSVSHIAFIFSLRHVFILILDSWKIWRTYDKTSGK